MVGNRLEGFGYYATTVVAIMITLLPIGTYAKTVLYLQTPQIRNKNTAQIK